MTEAHIELHSVSPGPAMPVIDPHLDPKIAAKSATRCPGSTSGSTAMLLNEADLSLSRHGVLPPRDTR